jgi:hypothetical protein
VPPPEFQRCGYSMAAARRAPLSLCLGDTNVAYRPLVIERSTPPRVKSLIRALENHYLEPLFERRNRKTFATESCCSLGATNRNLRVFYEVVPGDHGVVRIVAVGKKEGNVVRIAGKEIKL